MFNTKDHNRSSKPVITALRGFPKGLCDNCLSDVVGKSREDAVTPARRLLSPNYATRNYGTCERCQTYRKLNRLVTTKTLSEDSAASPLIRLRDLDSLWEQVTAYLDRLDGGGAKEDFASRIETLRKARKIAPTFATLLVTCLTYRHEARYRSFEASPEEDEILRHLLAFLGAQLGEAPKTESSSTEVGTQGDLGEPSGTSASR